MGFGSKSGLLGDSTIDGVTGGSEKVEDEISGAVTGVQLRTNEGNGGVITALEMGDDSVDVMDGAGLKGGVAETVVEVVVKVGDAFSAGVYGTNGEYG